MIIGAYSDSLWLLGRLRLSILCWPLGAVRFTGIHIHLIHDALHAMTCLSANYVHVDGLLNNSDEIKIKRH